jgi:hypothetical protein
MTLALSLAGCGAAGSTGTSPAPPGTPAASSATPSVVPSVQATPSASPSASPSAIANPIVGEWVRTASCAEALAAFEAAGLTDQVADWVVGNYVPEGAAAAAGKECANARPAVPHSHFFTGAGQFGSRDEHGQQVDDGVYRLVDADTLAFPTETGGEILVDVAITGDEVTFSVTVPAACEGDCRGDYGWAMSAFFGPRPFVRN